MPVSPNALEFDVVRVGADRSRAVTDVAAAEEPLELRLGGQPFVVTMRTPGADRELAAGFLISERIVRSAGEIAAMQYCADDRGSDSTNILSIWLTGEAALRAQRAAAGRRHVAVSSACGVCGRRSIEDLLDGGLPISANTTVRRDVIESLPNTLRSAQHTFDQTGGLHAAGVFTSSGELVRAAEDVGRHNAVDKVIGGCYLDDVQLSDAVLFVSGRTSFEIVQKAVVAGIPVVASVSAPSSLAIELARESRITLVGFVRGRSFNVYAGQERIIL